MVDTFHPLNLTKAASTSTTTAIRTRGSHRRTPQGHASELAERGPEAFPD